MNENVKSLAKYSKQLALGEKITSAADDSSGYVISEGLKVKIRGLGQCNENSSKGRDMLSIASAAVDQQINIMRSIKVNAICSANDTYTDSDRSIIQKETSQFFEQIDQIAKETSFNGVYMLNGSAGGGFKFDSTVPYRDNKGNFPVMTPANGLYGSFNMDFSGLNGRVNSIDDFNEMGFSFDCGTCSQFITFIFNPNSSNSEVYGGVQTGSVDPICYRIGVKNVDVNNIGYSLGEAIFNGVASANKAANPGAQPLTAGVPQTINVASHHTITMRYDPATGFSIEKGSTNPIDIKNGVMGKLVPDGTDPWTEFNFQTGDTSSNYTKYRVYTTTVSALFHDPAAIDESAARMTIDPYNCVTSMKKAKDFLGKVDSAIDYLLDASAYLGAQINRLAMTMDNLTVATENMTAADSVIRDADMAEGMVKFATNNMLVQSAQAMLGHANQDSSNVLGLLSNYIFYVFT